MKETKQEILTTSLNLFKNHGYTATSINDICRACGITKGTFYYHFNSKEELIQSYYNEISVEITSVFPEILREPNNLERLWKCIELFIDRTIELGPEQLKALLETDMRKGLPVFSPYQHKQSKELKSNNAIQIEIVKQGQAVGQIKQNFNPEVLLLAFRASLIGIALDWSSSGGTYSEKEALRECFDVIFKPYP